VSSTRPPPYASIRRISTPSTAGAIVFSTPETSKKFSRPPALDAVRPAGADVTLTMRSTSKGPVVWLTSGDVQIDGVIDLSGTLCREPAATVVALARLPRCLPGMETDLEGEMRHLMAADRPPASFGVGQAVPAGIWEAVGSGVE
jgi:hypothetical protein